jgi:RNA-splicing ligase RtcB
MNIVNLSAEPLGRLHSWLPLDLIAEKIVFLPDACPGKSPLPIGNESGIVDHFVDNPNQFDREFERVVTWAAENRSTIQKNLENEFGELEIILDSPHNTFEKVQDGSVIIRKGAVKLEENGLCVIPSHMSGDIVLAKGTSMAKEILFSMSHGTGRKMSRSECKPLADAFDFGNLRKNVMLADGIEDSSLRTEGPFAYRGLEECLGLLQGYVEEVERFSVIGYMGHL